MLVAAAILIAVAMRLPGVPVDVWNVDEGVIAGSAAVTAAGGLPYLDWVDHRAPLTNFIYAATFAVSGAYNMIAVRLLLLLVVGMLIVMVYRIGVRAVGKWGGAAAALLFAVASSAGFDAGDLFAFNAEWAMVLFTTLGMLLLMSALGGARRRRIAALGAGTAFALAFLAKQPAALDVAAAGGFLLASLARAGSGPSSGYREVLRVGALLAAGLALTLAVFAVCIAALGVWQPFAFYFYVYNVDYYSAPLSVPRLVATMGRAWWVAAGVLGLGWLAAAGAALALVGRRDAEQRAERRSLRLLIALWGIATLVGVALSGRLFGHYFIQLLPSWCLLGGLALQESVGLVERAIRALPAAIRMFVLGALLAAAVVWFVVVPWRAVSPGRVQVQERWVTDLPTAAAGAYLRRAMAPDDRLFVWGFYPSLYIHAARLPASRFLYCTFLVGANLGGGREPDRYRVPGSMDELLADLERTRPLYIVDTSPGDYFHWGRYPLRGEPRLWSFVAAHYRLDGRFAATQGSRHFLLYRRADDLPWPSGGDQVAVAGRHQGTRRAQ